MSALLEVPALGDLDGLPVEVAALDDPGAASVTAWANDGSTVTLTWDEVAGSVGLRWTQDDEVRLDLARETATKVSIREERGRVEFWIWSRSGELGGQLVVHIGDRVSVTDALLRQ